MNVLDDALARVSDLEFEPPVRFVSHAPMACEALVALGFEGAVDGWVKEFETYLVQMKPAATPSWPTGFEWRDLLGDRRILPEWVGFFERAIDEDGWPAVVGTWVPRFMPGLVGALFHGVIRTAHAVRASDTADTPERRAELARALGSWATWYGRGQPVDDAPRVEDLGVATAGAAAAGARCYVASPNILNLHGVTGAMAVHLLGSHIAPSDAAQALAQLGAEHRALYRGAVEGGAIGPADRWDGSVAAASVGSHDPHQVKLVEACRRGFDVTGDAAFVAAARVATQA